MISFSTLLLYLAILLPVVYVGYLVATSCVVRAVFARNLLSYFSGVLGYLFIVVFVVSAAILAFNDQFFLANLANLDQLTNSFPLLLLFIVPAITMTVWSDERKQGTDELLFTLPASDTEILLGKYLSVVAVYSIALLFSTGLWLVLETYADPGWNMFFSTYFGYWLAGSSLLAVGMFASSLTRSSTVAFVIGAIFCAVPVFLSMTALGGSSEVIEDLLGKFGTGAVDWYKDAMDSITFLTAFSIGEHLREFGLGVVRLTSVLYFESLAVLFLYLNLIVISKRHWSRRQQWVMSLQYAIRAASVLAILISLYIMSNQSSGRADIDLTPTNYFTLSDSTLEVLDNIEEDRPITIQAFLSPEVPTEYVRTKRRLEGLLRQIDQRGGSLVNVVIRPTEKYQPAADDASSFGIQPRRVTVEVDGKDVTEDVFLGLVVRSSYDQVVIPFLGRSIPVEFELTRSLRTVANAHRLTVGILETQARMMTNPNTREIIAELRKQYNVEPVSAREAIERERQLFAIEEDAVIEDLKSAKDDAVPESLIELFAKKKMELSENLYLTADDSGDAWTLKDFRVHRKYRIHTFEEDAPDGPEKPEEGATKYGVFIDQYDALIAVMPSTLTQAEMDNFVDYVKAGGPTLIFDDPIPVTLQYHPMMTLAPKANVNPTPQLQQDLGGARADNGEALSLLRALGITWDNGEVAWDLNNPFPEFEERWEPGVITVVDAGAAESEEAPLASPITDGLGRLVLLYAGQIQKIESAKTDFQPLLQTSPDVSGVFKWDEIAYVDQRPVGSDPRTRQPFFVEHIQIYSVRDNLPPRALEGLDDEEKKKLLEGSRFQPDLLAHTFAARIRGKGDNPVNAVFVADADLIGDQFFEIYREQTGNLDLDNVSFVLNVIDVLAGETAFLELRKGKMPQPTLTKIEEEKEKLRQGKLKAESEASLELAKEQAKLDKAVEELQKQLENPGEKTQAEMFASLQNIGMKLMAKKEEVDDKKKELKEELERKKQAAKTTYERGVKSVENWIRIKAVFLPALPAIALGLIFLSFRMMNETREITPDRSR